jgi:hypothetical protein
MVPPRAASPGPHPDPPIDLDTYPLPITAVRAGASWRRIYRLAFPPEYFDRSDIHRFNPPSGEFGVLYAGEDDHCAFIETFGRDLGLRVVAAADLAQRGRSRIEINGRLRLVDLTGQGLARLRADGRLTTVDYRVAQRWSLALHRHPDRPDGIMWRSRFDPSRTSFALYDRARPSIRTVPLGRLDDPGFASALADILAHYRFGLV